MSGISFEQLKQNLRSLEKRSENITKEKTHNNVYIPKKPIPEPITPKQIYDMAWEQDIEDRVLMFALYTTGGRINEVLMLRYCDFIKEPFGDKIGYVAHLFTEKNRREQSRDIPIPSEGKCWEGEMIREIFKYKKLAQHDIEDKIFRWKDRNCRRRLAKINFDVDVAIFDEKGKHKERFNGFSLFPHYLRHCRATHLVRHYHLGGLKLMKVMGWTDERPARIYVHMNIDDLKMAIY